MRRFLLPALAAGVVAAFAFAAPQPASANPAAAAINYDKSNAGVVEQVGRRYYRKRYRYGYSPYRYRNYGYYRRPYYRPYYGGYYRPYYRPYYGGYGYPYWRRPGVSLWFGF
jgi:hypothetical protein